MLRWPDPKKVLIDFLAELLPPEVHVGSQVPVDRPDRFVRVLVTGGAGVDQRIFVDVQFTVEVWGQSEGETSDMAWEIFSAVKHSGMWGDTPVYNPRFLGIPVIDPDNSKQSRFSFTFRVLFRPL